MWTNTRAARSDLLFPTFYNFKDTTTTMRLKFCQKAKKELNAKGQMTAAKRISACAAIQTGLSKMLLAKKCIEDLSHFLFFATLCELFKTILAAKR